MKMDLCTKLENITSRIFALNWKNFSEKLDLCTNLEKITNMTSALKNLGVVLWYLPTKLLSIILRILTSSSMRLFTFVVHDFV